MANDGSSCDLTVYYDGSCPLCRAEIDLYRRAAGAEALAFVDVSAADAPLPAGVDRTAALARFHVADSEGRVISGGVAFARLWQSLPRWRWLGRLFTRPPLSWTLEAAYRVFLPLRPALQGLARRLTRS